MTQLSYANATSAPDSTVKVHAQISGRLLYVTREARDKKQSAQTLIEENHLMTST